MGTSLLIGCAYSDAATSFEASLQFLRKDLYIRLDEQRHMIGLYRMQLYPTLSQIAPAQCGICRLLFPLLCRHGAKERDAPAVRLCSVAPR